jgi:hypothetical protein
VRCSVVGLVGSWVVVLVCCWAVVAVAFFLDMVLVFGGNVCSCGIFDVEKSIFDLGTVDNVSNYSNIKYMGSLITYKAK